MDFDNPDAIIRIRMEIEDHVEQTRDEAVSELGWTEEGKASLGWCVGVHVADTLQRLLGDGHRLGEAYDAVVSCIKDHREHLQKRQG